MKIGWWITMIIVVWYQVMGIRSGPLLHSTAREKSYIVQMDGVFHPLLDHIYNKKTDLISMNVDTTAEVSIHTPAFTFNFSDIIDFQKPT